MSAFLCGLNLACVIFELADGNRITAGVHAVICVVMAYQWGTER